MTQPPSVHTRSSAQHQVSHLGLQLHTIPAHTHHSCLLTTNIHGCPVWEAYRDGGISPTPKEVTSCTHDTTLLVSQLRAVPIHPHPTPSCMPNLAGRFDGTTRGLNHAQISRHIPGSVSVNNTKCLLLSSTVAPSPMANLAWPDGTAGELGPRSQQGAHTSHQAHGCEQHEVFAADMISCTKPHGQSCVA